jgi:putative FmdB family regulatory protein
VPTYEYACTKCGQHVEVFQHISDDPLTECGVCGGKLRKVFHPAGILFKGSGFYSTDSRSKSSGGDGGSKKSTEAASSEKSGDGTKSGDGAKSDGGTAKGPGDSKSSGDGAKKDAKPSGAKEKSA